MEEEKQKIPRLVHTYGAIIQFLQFIHVIGLAVLVAFKIISFLSNAGEDQGSTGAFGVWGHGIVIVLAYSAIGLAISIALFRVGGGLRRGLRSAVWGLCIWCGAGLILVIISGIFIPSIYTYIAFGYLMVFYYPPVVAAYIRWERFS